MTHFIIVIAQPIFVISASGALNSFNGPCFFKIQPTNLGRKIIRNSKIQNQLKSVTQTASRRWGMRIIIPNKVDQQKYVPEADWMLDQRRRQWELSPILSEPPSKLKEPLLKRHPIRPKNSLIIFKITDFIFSDNFCDDWLQDGRHREFSKKSSYSSADIE